MKYLLVHQILTAHLTMRLSLSSKRWMTVGENMLPVGVGLLYPHPMELPHRHPQVMPWQPLVLPQALPQAVVLPHQAARLHQVQLRLHCLAAMLHQVMLGLHQVQLPPLQHQLAVVAGLHRVHLEGGEPMVCPICKALSMFKTAVV